MAFAQPAVRANFLYNGDLYVDVGNLNRHKRASVQELSDLLRPDLKKVKAIPPAKDQVAHWYEAQLVHYGLPPTKDKARAKVRLLDNLNSSNLKVPAGIATIETELKKEFNAAERKAKAQHKASMTDSKPAATGKRKQQDATANTEDKLNNNVSFDSNEPKATTSSAMTWQNEPPPTKRPRQTAQKTRGGTSGPGSGCDPARQNRVTSQAMPPKFATKQTARRSGGFAGAQWGSSRPVASQGLTPDETGNHAVQPSCSPMVRTYAKKQTARRNPAPPSSDDLDEQTKPKKTSKIKREITIKKEPKAKADPNSKVKQEAAVKREPSVKQERQPTNPSLGLINGIYDISCPAIESGFHSNDLTLILTLDSPSIWGAYDFGAFTGIIHVSERPYTADGKPLGFHWRGRETGEGEMSFGDDCFGEVHFSGNGRIAGWMNLSGDCQFEGRRRNGPGTQVRTAASMRDEWEEYNEDEYERERIGRW